jgi:hypothetical protein
VIEGGGTRHDESYTHGPGASRRKRLPGWLRKSYSVDNLTDRYRTAFYTGVTGGLSHRLARHTLGLGSRFGPPYRIKDVV